MKIEKIYTITCWVQAIYYLITSLWGLLHIESFMAVTGPKADIWLVKTVSVLILPIVVCLLGGLFFPTHPVPVILVAATAAAGFAAIDFYYTGRHIIRWVYAMDGVVQTVLLLVWLFLLSHWRKLMPRQKQAAGVAE
jgi:hypothetical protein